MLDLGKRPYGSGRNPNCSKCGALKDDVFKTSGYCRACRAERVEQKRLKERLERGQRPLGEGRSTLCYDCKKPKENPKHGWCNECHNKHQRAARERKKQDPEFAPKERKKVNDRIKNDPVFKHKIKMRWVTNICIKQGVLIRQPCEVCGNEKVDAHHDDYMQPLNVRWLCRKHHNEHHRNEIIKE